MIEDLDMKKINLNEEVDNSINLIITGLKELQMTITESRYYFIALQLLSNGIERLLKCIICYGYFNKNKKFPIVNEIKTHDIIKLKDKIVDKYFTMKTELTKNDLDYLKNNQELNALLKLLSEFGKQSRYHNLNIVTGNTRDSLDIKELWNEYQSKYFLGDKELIKKLTTEPDFEKVDEAINAHFVSLFETFVRAMVRQFTLGNLGEEAKACSCHISPFLFLKDSDIGKTDYQEKYFQKENLEPVKYKNIYNSRSKIVRKEAYKGIWPFKVDEIMVERRNGNCIVVIIEGFEYALNGLAIQLLKLPSPFESGKAYVGRSISYFIELGLSL